MKLVNYPIRATTNHLKKIIVVCFVLFFGFFFGLFVVVFFCFFLVFFVVFFFFFVFFWGVSLLLRFLFTFSSMTRKWVTSTHSYSFRELICAIILAFTFSNMLTCTTMNTPKWMLIWVWLVTSTVRTRVSIIYCIRNIRYCKTVCALFCAQWHD